MSGRKRRALAGIWLSLAAGLAFAAPLPQRDEYAYVFPLIAQGDAEYFAVDVPLEVYQSVSDAGLRDAGVFNAAGQPVPRKFEHPQLDDSTIEQKATLGLAPLYGQLADQPDQLRVLLYKDAKGIALDMNSGEENAGAVSEGDAEETPTSYIVDLRNVPQTLQALEFDWPSVPQGFIGTVQLEDSTDLQYWQDLGAYTLAQLHYEDTAIERKRVRLNRKVANYLRVTWSGMPERWRLNSVAGIYNERDAAPERAWLTADSLLQDTKEDAYLYDIAAYPPTDRLNLILPGENVVVRASIFYRPNVDADWRLATSGIFYNISRKGVVFQPPDVQVRAARAAHWKVRIDSGRTIGPVQLRLGWRPDRLLFVAQGTPPFELVTGRLKDRLEGFPQEKILGDDAFFAMLRQSGQAGNAALGPRAPIAGSDGLNAAMVSSRTLLLWGGLIFAVVLVGWLVYTLHRDLKPN